MELTDLELLIKKFEIQQNELMMVMSVYENEPEADYARQSMTVIYESLSILRSFKENHSEIGKKVNELMKMRKRIGGIARTMVKNIALPEQYKEIFPRSYRDPIATIEIYLKKVKAIQAQISKLESELETMQYDGREGSKPDFIYENIEAMYDGLLDGFEIKFSGTNDYKEHYVSISRIGNIIEISILKHSDKIDQYGRYNYFHKVLADIGFTEKEEIWKFIFDVEIEEFDTLISAVARMLFEARLELQIKS